jgi:hypothetical protein
MQKTYLIFGYGIPKNILTDTNYQTYLNIVFNTIYADTIKNGTIPNIILSGGKTDLQKPYNRTEAEEMLKFFKHHIQESNLQTVTKHWKFFPEKKALSTLENFLYGKDLIQIKKLPMTSIAIFCETTRKLRIQTLAKKLFSKTKIQIHAIDFDTSPSRYLDPKLLQQKEQTEIKHSLWALKTKANLKKHHTLFQQKLTYLRQPENQKNPNTIKDWWEQIIKNTLAK